MEVGTWYQCRICKVICSSSKVMMTTHERKHARRSIHKLEHSTESIPGISQIWSVVKFVTENGDGGDEVKEELKEEPELELPVEEDVIPQQDEPVPDPVLTLEIGGEVCDDDEEEDDGPPILSPYPPSTPSPPPPPARPRKKRNHVRATATSHKNSKFGSPTTRSRSTRAKVTSPLGRTHLKKILPSNPVVVPVPRPLPEPHVPPKRKKLPVTGRRGCSSPSKRKAAKDKVNPVEQRTVDFTITESCRIVTKEPPMRISPAVRSRLNNSSHSENASIETVCDICGFIGRTPTDLKDHSRTHSKEKPFVCPACSARFSRTQNMRHHIRFNCEEAKRLGLADKFQKKAAEHVKRSQARLPTAAGAADSILHECTKCVEKFSTLLRLNHHSRVHTVGKDGAVYTCCFCQGDFYSDRSATDHMARVHNTEMKTKFQCRHCSKYLSTNNSLRRHMHLSHFDEEFGTGSGTEYVPSVKYKKARPSSLDSVPVSKMDSRVVGAQKEISKEHEAGSDVEWVDTPKIVKVEHVVGPPPRDNNAPLLFSKLTTNNGPNQPRHSSAQKHKLQLQELEEPEMEIRMGGNEYFAGNDPLAF